MAKPSKFGRAFATRPALNLARVLLVHHQLAPRLTLQSVLRAGGYSVDVAATESEGLSKLDQGSYELVLSDAEKGRDLLAYARVKDYRPATAVITSDEPWSASHSNSRKPQISVCAENLPTLL